MTSREVVIATVKMAGQSQPMMKEKTAVMLSGCGGPERLRRRWGRSDQ